MSDGRAGKAAVIESYGSSVLRRQSGGQVLPVEPEWGLQGTVSVRESKQIGCGFPTGLKSHALQLRGWRHIPRHVGRDIHDRLLDPPESLPVQGTVACACSIAFA